jgi:hypothetical protein
VGAAVRATVRATVVRARRTGGTAVGRALRAGHVVVIESHGVSVQVDPGLPDGNLPSLLTSAILA